jgi:hypothetical protein
MRKGLNGNKKSKGGRLSDNKLKRKYNAEIKNNK